MLVNRQNPYAGNFFKYNAMHSVPFSVDNFFILPSTLLSDIENVDWDSWNLHPVLPARFMQKVRMLPNGCWEWTGWIASNPKYPHHKYGCLKYRTEDGQRRSTSAHRFAYIVTHGPIPEDYDVDHTCQFKLCVNPSHLEAVTHQENIRRIPFDSRGGWQLFKENSTCVHGHAWTPESTYFAPGDGRRRCRKCNASRQYTSRRSK